MYRRPLLPEVHVESPVRGAGQKCVLWFAPDAAQSGSGIPLGTRKV